MWNRKFGRNADHRKAMLRNLATSVILYGRVETTEAKAKDMRSVVLLVREATYMHAIRLLLISETLLLMKLSLRQYYRSYLTK